MPIKFINEEFTSHAGLNLPFKIEVEDLTLDEADVFAKMISKLVTYKEVMSIPRGGDVLAEACRKYIDPESPNLIIVDDVCTTGASMREAFKEASYKGWAPFNIYGFCLFARDNELPHWVRPIFWPHSEFVGDIKPLDICSPVPKADLFIMKKLGDQASK